MTRAGRESHIWYQHTATPAVALPTLVTDIRTDVAILGAGYAGLSSALHLAEHGIEVVALDARDIGLGASGRNGGQVNAGLWHEPEAIESHLGAQLGGRLVALAYQAPDYVFHLIRKHSIQCDAVQSGSIRLAATEPFVTHLESSARQYALRGLDIDVLDLTQLRRRTGTSRYSRGLLNPKGGTLNPLSYARGLAGAALKAGAILYANSPALRITAQANGWRIDTPSGRLTAERLLICTNAYTDALWPKLKQSVLPVRTAIVASAPLDEQQLSELATPGMAFHEATALPHYFRIDSSRRLLMGGLSPFKEITRPRQVKRLIGFARALWPTLARTTWDYAWNGKVAMTPDHYPHIHNLARNVWACLGCNGRGIALLSCLGAQMADLLAEERTPDVPVTPLRALPMHDLACYLTQLRLGYMQIMETVRG